MALPAPTTITMLVLIPLIAWRLYSRIRRMVGRQRLSRVRPWITLGVFPLVILLLALAQLPRPANLAFLVAGVTGGGLLGVYGLRMTRFEPAPEGLFYTPNAHLGIALSLLFLARIAWRLVELFMLQPHAARAPDEFARSPLTLAIFGLLAGYYIAYAIGLVRWRAAVMAQRRDREAAATLPEH
ncbi:MAG TPA: hypothetical protein VFJ62_10495 [Usitatibacter sp.]|nr:hypothetical protein [Usitatibacter sp.]